jgi:uncharacterized membrane protein
VVDIPFPRRPRFAIVDVARGVAIVAMVLYHAIWDLGPDFFGYTTVDAARDLPLVIAARLIAGSFLFIVGVSLVLAHRNGFRLERYLRRLGIIVAAALLVTLVTRLLVPDWYVRFGILHAIAAASVIGVVFLRAPIWLTLIAAAAAFAAPSFLASNAFNQPGWIWLGLSTYVPPAADYVPVLPWVGPTLLGIVATRLVFLFGIDQRLAAWHPTSAISRWLIKAGQWSLVIYLVHQPLLLGVLYLITLAIGRELPALV